MKDMFHKDPLLEENPSPHSPHSIIPKLVPEKSLVLDVGCNTGYMAHKLKEKNCNCDGIDINEKALNIAKQYARRVYKRDLYDGKLAIDKELYDVIIFADLLEHLPRPDLLLKDSLQYLEKNGIVLISMPNVARIEIRLKLLLGNFDYTEGGILSQDHLRLFTRKSATYMIETCGYKVKKTIPTGLGHIIKVFPTFTAFQFIYCCKKVLQSQISSYE